MFFHTFAVLICLFHALIAGTNFYFIQMQLLREDAAHRLLSCRGMRDCTLITAGLDEM